MPEIYDLHRPRKVFLDQPPNPERSITQDHHLLGPLQSLLHRQRVLDVSRMWGRP